MDKLNNKSIITWNDGVPTSDIYGDIYFSTEDGLDETKHVFLKGNNLPERWKVLNDNFHIIETGFGTGLNFFASWKMWNETSSDKTLYYTSIEKHPLTICEIKRAISIWPELQVLINEFESQYPHVFEYSSKLILSSNNVQLNLLWGDVNYILPTVEKKADAWFLDGFSPKKNPDMWNDNLYKNMKNLTLPGGTFATFTASGNVRRGLLENGFRVKKTPGYGKKRHILIGDITF